MRRIGTLDGQDAAERFRDYLTTQHIEAVVESIEGSEQWSVWVRDEDQRAAARQELQRFLDDPQHERYGTARQQAAQLRRQKERENRDRLRLQRSMPSRSGPIGPMAFGAGSRRPTVTLILIALAVGASLLTNFGNVRRADLMRQPTQVPQSYQIFNLLSAVDRPAFVETGDPMVSVKRGQIWRLITPVFLHGNMQHLLFNMLMLYFLGSLIERLHGSAYFAGIFLMTGLVSGVAQSIAPEFLGGTPFSIGASGAVYGLFGFLWIRPILQPQYPVRMPTLTVAIMLGWLILCMTPMSPIPNVANVAHVAGLLAGIAWTLAVVGASRRRG
jgi:GlpG protein